MTDEPKAEAVPVRDASEVKPPALEWDEPQARPANGAPAPTLEQAHPVAAEEVPQNVAGTNWYYCLNENHPGALPLSASPLDVNRLFEDRVHEVPVCPVDGSQNSWPAEGPDLPPRAALELASRFQTG